MKQSGIIIRTIAAMAIIFASGVWVGHTLCPPKAPDVSLPIETSPPTHKKTAPLGPNARRIAAHYRRELSLDNNQFEQFVTVFNEHQKIVVDMPRRSQERADSIRTLHEKLKPLLRDDQGRQLDKIMQEVDDKVAPE